MSNSSSNSSFFLDTLATATNLRAQAISLSIFSLLGTAIIIIPFIWHYRNKNLAACTLFAWLVLSNTFTFVNAIIWPNEDFANWWDGAGLCDIEAKLLWPMFTGIPCSICCIVRSLAKVLRVDRANLNPTKKQRRRKLLVDCLICLLIPFLQLVLHYCVQPDRYIIIAVGGCAPSFDSSWPTIVIMYIWPPICALVSCYYAILIIIRMRRYRTQFAHILEASNSNLTTSRFLRLFLMSLSVIAVFTPVSLYLFYVNLNIPWFPYSWSSIHDPATWNVVLKLPFLGIRTLDRWLLIILTFDMFLFFGMGSDAIEIYRVWLTNMGFARIWPSLALPRSRKNSGSSGSRTGWTHNFSVITKAKKYFDERALRKGSHDNSISTTINTRVLGGCNQKSSFSTTSSTEPKQPAFVHIQEPTATYRHPTLSILPEYPSSHLPDFANPSTNLDPEAQTSSFPGISGTSTSRHVNGGLFGGHQGSRSPFNLGIGSLPSMKFSPMNLFPSIGLKRWSRTTSNITSPVPEMSQSPSLVVVVAAKDPAFLPRVEERAKSREKPVAQYRDGSSKISGPGHGITPLNTNSSRRLMSLAQQSSPTFQPSGLQTAIYSSHSRLPKGKESARERERLGSASSENLDVQNVDVGMRIQVRKKMEQEVERDNGMKILKRDNFTGRVYEE